MSPRLLLVPVAVALIMLGLVTIVHAQTAPDLTVTLGLPTAAATPGGDPVLIPFTIGYPCETLWGTGGTITIKANVTNTGVSAAPVPASVTPVTLPDCSAGETNTHVGNISVVLAEDAPYLAGDQPDFIVYVEAKAAAGTTHSETPTTVDVAPIVALDYTTNETALTAQQGELITILIDVTSMSNDEVTVATTFPDWNLSDTPPDVLDVTLAMPADNGTPMNQIEILFEVPEDAEATTHTFTVQLSASPAGDRSLDVTENITYELTVQEKKGGGGGGKDSPGPALPLLVVFTVAAAGFLRRRR